jgi:ribosomal protein S18 acetylase RimI-like enzyme
MKPKIDVRWPRRADQWLRDEVHRLLHAVVSAGGAVGFVEPPSQETSDGWLDGMLKTVRRDQAAMVIAVTEEGEQLVAMGLWQRRSHDMFAHSADILKVMAHPDHRGQGLGRLMVTNLVDDALDNGIETLTLGVRGNNSHAIEVYRELGFEEWGRLPNVIEVGNERFDDVRMCRVLQRADDVVLRGSALDDTASTMVSGKAGSDVDVKLDVEIDTIDEAA